MQMQWACTDIVPPWKDTHNKLSLNTVKETFSSYSGVFEAGWGCSPRGGRCDTLSLGPVPHMATHCSSAHRTALQLTALLNWRRHFPAPMSIMGLGGNLNWFPHLWIQFILFYFMHLYMYSFGCLEDEGTYQRSWSMPFIIWKNAKLLLRGHKALVFPVGSHSCPLIVC